jgi:hypothetical protein
MMGIAGAFEKEVEANRIMDGFPNHFTSAGKGNARKWFQAC